MPQQNQLEPHPIAFERYTILGSNIRPVTSPPNNATTTPFPKLKSNVSSSVWKSQDVLLKYKNFVKLGYNCTLCDKKFDSEVGLRKHINQTHETGDDKQFKCSQCDKAYNSSHHLRRHVSYVHMGKTNHTCSYCNRGFLNVDDLKSHLSTHTLELYFSCDTCGSKFRSKKGLHSHVKRDHETS